MLVGCDLPANALRVVTDRWIAVPILRRAEPRASRQDAASRAVERPGSAGRRDGAIRHAPRRADGQANHDDALLLTLESAFGIVVAANQALKIAHDALRFGLPRRRR